MVEKIILKFQKESCKSDQTRQLLPWEVELVGSIIKECYNDQYNIPKEKISKLSLIYETECKTNFCKNLVQINEQKYCLFSEN